MEKVTLEYALDISIVNIIERVGIFMLKDVVLNTGKFGNYDKYNNKNYSVNEKRDINLKDAIEIIKNSNNSTSENSILKKISKDIIIKRRR